MCDYGNIYVHVPRIIITVGPAAAWPSPRNHASGDARDRG